MMQFGKQRPGSRDDEPNTVRRILRLCAGRRLQFSALHCRWPSPRPSPRRWWWTSSPAGIADVGERAAATGPGDATLRERMVVCCLRRSRHVPPFEPRRSTAVPVGCRLILRGSISHFSLAVWKTTEDIEGRMAARGILDRTWVGTCEPKRQECDRRTDSGDRGTIERCERGGSRQYKRETLRYRRPLPRTGTHTMFLGWQASHLNSALNDYG